MASLLIDVLWVLENKIKTIRSCYAIERSQVLIICSIDYNNYTLLQNRIRKNNY